MCSTRRSNLQEEETNTEPLYATILHGDNPDTWWQVDYIGPLPSGKRQHFVLIGIWHFFWNWICLPWPKSSQTTNCGLTEHIIYFLVFHIALLWSGTHFKEQVLPLDSWNSLVFMEFTGLTMFPIILKQLVWKNGEMVLWRPSQHQLGAIPFRPGARFPRRLHVLSISIQYVILFLLKSGCKGPGIKCGNESGTIHYYP